jgi:hypothetical protein
MNKQVEEYIAKRKAEAGAHHQPEHPYPRTLALWENEHGRLISSPLRKSDIPPHTRLLFLKNRKKEKGDRQPDYIGYFVQGSKEAAQGIEAPFIALQNLTNEMI